MLLFIAGFRLSEACNCFGKKKQLYHNKKHSIVVTVQLGKIYFYLLYILWKNMYNMAKWLHITKIEKGLNEE